MDEENPNGHVEFETFATAELGNQEQLRAALASTKAMDGYSAQLLNREFYETLYGIHNHADRTLSKNRPLASVAIHQAEDTYTYSMLRRYLFRYRHHEINKNWGLSLSEYLNLPWNIANDLFAIDRERIRHETRIKDAAAAAEAARAAAAGK